MFLNITSAFASHDSLLELFRIRKYLLVFVYMCVFLLLP